MSLSVLPILLVLFFCLQGAQAQFGDDPKKTCVLSQLCKTRQSDMCTQASDGVQRPIHDIRAPKPIDGFIAPDVIPWTCPMYSKAGMDVCCNNDQVSIMNNSFVAVKSVFGEEAGACGVNLRTFFCHFTCHPRQDQFIQFLGVNLIKGQNYSMIRISMDEDYACKIFTSCNKVSLIAVADLQSSISFFDFMGLNGQDQSMSTLTFVTDPLCRNKEDGTPSDCPKSQLLGNSMLKILSDPKLEKKCSERNIEGENLLVDPEQAPNSRMMAAVDDEEVGDVEKYGIPLQGDTYPCSEEIKGGELGGYVEVKDSSCTFCDGLCEAPNVDASIGFLEGGFSGVTIATFYGVLAGFSLFYQIYVCYYRNPKVKLHMVDLEREFQYKNFKEQNENKESTPSTPKLPSGDVNMTAPHDMSGNDMTMENQQNFKGYTDHRGHDMEEE